MRQRSNLTASVIYLIPLNSITLSLMKNEKKEMLIRKCWDTLKTFWKKRKVFLRKRNRPEERLLPIGDPNETGKDFDVLVLKTNRTYWKIKDEKSVMAMVPAHSPWVRNILYIRMKLENMDDTAENIIRIKKEIIQNNTAWTWSRCGGYCPLAFPLLDETDSVPTLIKIMQGNSCWTFNGWFIFGNEKSPRTKVSYVSIMRWWFTGNAEWNITTIFRPKEPRILKPRIIFFHHPEDVAKDAIVGIKISPFLSLLFRMFLKRWFDAGNPPFKEKSARLYLHSIKT